MSMVKLLTQIHQQEGIHLRELSRALNVGMPTIKHHLKKMEKEGLIKKEREGRNLKLYLNYENTQLIPYLYQAEYRRYATLPEKVRKGIQHMLSQLSKKPLLTLIFGSHAKGTYTEESDVDLFMAFNQPNKEDIEAKSRAAGYRYGIRISPVYLPYTELARRFHNPRDRFISELKENKIIIQGIEWWVQLEQTR